MNLLIVLHSKWIVLRRRCVFCFENVFRGSKITSKVTFKGVIAIENLVKIVFKIKVQKKFNNFFFRIYHRKLRKNQEIHIKLIIFWF